MCLPRLTNSVTVRSVRLTAASCGTRKSDPVRTRPASASFIRLAASQTVSPSGTSTRYVADAGSDVVEDRLPPTIVLSGGDEVVLPQLLKHSQPFGRRARWRRGRRCARGFAREVGDDVTGVAHGLAARSLPGDA